MKRIVASVDQETDLADLARAQVKTLDSDIAKLHNIISKWEDQIQQHPDNSSLMNNIVNSASYMQSEIDQMLDYYLRVLYTSKV